MSKRVCPWWLGYWLLNPLRRMIHNPDKILAPFVTAGMTVLGWAGIKKAPTCAGALVAV